MTSRLLEKNPDSAIPISRNALALKRPFGLGFKSFLNVGKIVAGMAPREEAGGGE